MTSSSHVDYSLETPRPRAVAGGRATDGVQDRHRATRGRSSRHARTAFRCGTLAAWLMVGCGAWLAATLVGCGGSTEQAETKKPKFEVADDSGSEPAAPAPAAGAMDQGAKPVEAANGKPSPATPAAPAPAKPPSIAGNQLDSVPAIAVPDGSVDQLLAQIDQLQKKYSELTKQRPSASEESRVLNQLRSICAAEMKAADKVLDAQPPAEKRRKAVNARLHAMRFLSLVAPQKSQVEDVRRFAQRIAVDKDPEISLQGRVILLGLKVGDLRSNKTKDLAGLMNDLKALLAAKNREQSVLDVTQQAEMTLRMLGHEKEADEAFKAIAEAFKNHADPALAKEAANMFGELKLRALGLDEKLDALARKEKGAAKPFLDAMKQALTTSEPTELMLNKALRAVNMLEQTGQYAVGVQLCRLVKDTFDKAKNEKLKNDAAHAIDMALRRLQLVGKPLEIQGVTVQGTKFDFSKYKGKVVLVDFWATWCGPCVAELPNLEDNYQKYHDKGFEIIGVNLDQNRDAVTRFLETHKLPWTTIVNNELVQQCGIEAIPFVLLLDRQGVVIALHVQGAQLGKKLLDMLGPPAKTPALPALKPPAQPAAPVTKPPGRGAAPPPSATKSSYLPLHGNARAAESFAAARCAEMTQDSAAPPAREASRSTSTAAAAAADKLELPEIDEATNPYLAPQELAPNELVEFLLDMEEKPRSIQMRPGFTEAIVDAANRVLAAKVKPQFRTVAALAMLSALHKQACLGDDGAEQQLRAAMTRLQGETSAPVVDRLAFLRLEHEALDSDQLAVDKLPALLAKLRTYLAKRDALTATHLRLASQTVHIINRLDDAKLRDKYFKDFGELFAASKNKQLAHYGKTLIGDGGQRVDLAGKQLELKGETAMGLPFDWAGYRGKFVVVDFWATWCGPCRAETPRLKALRDKHAGQLRLVGISLDADMEALAKYLQKETIDWETLVGPSAQKLAKRYGVRGIPTMMLVDPEGKVLTVGHHAAELETVLAKKLAER